MANDTACDRALQTTELLELMLLHLPPKQVLLAQRVCLHWKNTISGSVKLQQALYFRPLQLKLAQGTIQTSLKKDFQMAHDTGRCTVEVEDTTRIVRLHASEASAENYLHALAADAYRVANPMVTVPFSASIDEFFRAGGSKRRDMVGTLRFKPGVQQRSAASWEKMYLVQPPATKVYIAEGYKDRHQVYDRDTGDMYEGHMMVYVKCVVKNPEGVKVADFVSALGLERLYERGDVVRFYSWVA